MAVVYVFSPSFSCEICEKKLGKNIFCSISYKILNFRLKKSALNDKDQRRIPDFFKMGFSITQRFILKINRINEKYEKICRSMNVCFNCVTGLQCLNPLNDKPLIFSASNELFICVTN